MTTIPFYYRKTELDPLKVAFFLSPLISFLTYGTYRIFVRLLVLGPVRRVGELLLAVVRLGVLAAERLVPGVGPPVDLAILQSGEGAGAALELQKKKRKIN